MWALLSRAVKRSRCGALHCSFCGRDEKDVSRLVAGAAAHICDDCVKQSVTVLQQHGGFDMLSANRTP